MLWFKDMTVYYYYHCAVASSGSRSAYASAGAVPLPAAARLDHPPARFFRGLRLARAPSWNLPKATVSRYSFAAGKVLLALQYPSDQRCCAVSGNRVRPTTFNAVSLPSRCPAPELYCFIVKLRLIIERSLNYFHQQQLIKLIVRRPQLLTPV